MSDKLADHMAYPPLLFRSERAAAFVSMSETAFLQAVKEGLMPQPIKIKGGTFWDADDIRAAVRRLKGEEEVNTIHAILKRKP